MDLLPRLYFSYGQFLVFDQNVAAPGCLWTEKHSAQGFARRESVVSVGTLLEFGHADVAYIVGRFMPDESYERVIAVPFIVETGRVVVEGPNEMETQRFVDLPVGNYRLVAAQRATGDEEEVIGLFFERLAEPLRQSKIIVADEQLEPPGELLETADVA